MLHLLTQRNSTFKEVISYKSRPLRNNEIDWVDFHYVTPADFEHLIQADVFLEYALIHNMYYYGTKRSDIEDALQEGKVIIKEIDIQWIVKISENHHDLYKNAFTVFLDLSDETMVHRITTRAPISAEEVEKRLLSAKTERQLAAQYCNKIVSAEWTIEEVYQLVYKAIQDFINQHK